MAERQVMDGKPLAGAGVYEMLAPGQPAPLCHCENCNCIDYPNKLGRCPNCRKDSLLPLSKEEADNYKSKMPREA